MVSRYREDIAQSLMCKVQQTSGATAASGGRDVPELLEGRLEDEGFTMKNNLVEWPLGYHSTCLSRHVSATSRLYRVTSLPRHDCGTSRLWHDTCLPSHVCHTSRLWNFTSMTRHVFAISRLGHVKTLARHVSATSRFCHITSLARHVSDPSRLCQVSEDITQSLMIKVQQTSGASGLLLQAVAARCQSCLKVG